MYITSLSLSTSINYHLLIYTIHYCSIYCYSKKVPHIAIHYKLLFLFDHPCKASSTSTIEHIPLDFTNLLFFSFQSYLQNHSLLSLLPSTKISSKHHSPHTFSFPTLNLQRHLILLPTSEDPSPLLINNSSSIWELHIHL